MDRMVSALVCEDHMLQGGLFWTSEQTKVGEEILRIYKELIQEWNDKDGKVTWMVARYRNLMSSFYDIIIKQSVEHDGTLIRVKWIGSELFLWFHGSLVNHPDENVQFRASRFTNQQTEEEKKNYLSGLIKHTP